MRRRNLWLSAAMAIVIIASLVLVSCGEETTPTTAGPTTTAGAATTTSGTGVDAATLYSQNCADPACHPSVPAGQLDAVKAAIEDGVGSEMPGFRDKLTPEQIDALAAWVANGGR
jgi:mono/diheme cytochrome c family protein